MPALALSLPHTLDRAGDLGSMPVTAQHIREVADNPRSSLRDLEQAVAADPLLAARILKFANAAHYGLVRQVTDLRQAVVVLGMRAVRDVAIGMAIASTAVELLDDEARAFLHHSLTAAVIGQCLQPRGSQAAHDAFISGLLHDIGLLVQIAVHGEPYRKLLRRFDAEGERITAAERMAFGFDHADLGAALLDRWALPGRVVHAVRHHHHRQAADGPTALLLLADELSHDFAAGRRLGDIVRAAVDHPASGVLRLPEARLVIALGRVRDVIAELGAVY